MQTGWKARIRRWLWLVGNNVRTDKSQANRGFYAGGPPVGWRFMLPVVAGGIVIALIILVARDAEVQATDEGQRPVPEKPGFAVTVPADRDVETIASCWTWSSRW